MSDNLGYFNFQMNSIIAKSSQLVSMTGTRSYFFTPPSINLLSYNISAIFKAIWGIKGLKIHVSMNSTSSLPWSPGAFKNYMDK